MKEDEKRMCGLFETACDGIYDIEPISSCTTFTMGVTSIQYDSNTNTIHVYLRRPGLLIGKEGHNVDRIASFLDCKIEIHQVTKLGVPFTKWIVYYGKI